LRQATGQVRALAIVGKVVEVCHQFQASLLGALQCGPIAFVHQCLALLQQLCDAVIEIVVLTIFDSRKQHRLPAFAILQPAAVLFAQGMCPDQHALTLLCIQVSEPIRQSLLHALGAFTNLLIQRRSQVFLTVLAAVFLQPFAQLRDLIVTQRAQHVAGGRGDFHGDGVHGFANGAVVGLEVALIELAVSAIALELLDAGEQFWQLGAAVPGEVFTQPLA